MTGNDFDIMGAAPEGTHWMTLPRRDAAKAALAKAGIPTGIAETVAEICETGRGVSRVHPAWFLLAAGETTVAPPESEIVRWHEGDDGHWRCW